MHIPDTLYHRTTKLAYDSIRENGLLGPHNGHWAIYLSERPETWAGLHDGDNILFSVDTRNLDKSKFTFVDPKLDELLYWGKVDGIIKIPPDAIKPIK